ncbi:hypothetical protein K493DRAFT_318953 [Basidiobolus meristosporus CBS 931.73]|uniref:Cyclin N-terminal domain-containing protein n=1 Tax=Basidiobolus meristosporus CBS 931.73 TaxID=1314790 RepID=A0A1Y1XTL5_9FUNG|nr:hypothetical protein K493DRAFT_318953 [Basidiobolus meristosporus CBS 931.73]|eukprot:ORX89117.1 hypothetical protein K493DRAFT_318953 [Basidiobolus meristosporus CBS 931.73]
MSASISTRSGVSLAGNKANFLDLTFDFAVLTLHSILSQTFDTFQLNCFLRRVVHYSGTTYSTLLTAILYLFRLNSMRAVPAEEDPLGRFREKGVQSPVGCGGRLFMAALVTAHKFLQDRAVSTQTWSRLSNIPIPQLNTDELEFLKAIQFQLFITTRSFEKWSVLLRTTTASGNPRTFPTSSEPVHATAKRGAPYECHQLRHGRRKIPS